MSRAFELKGAHVAWGMGLFFGAIIAVNAVFITLAVGSFPGEDVRRSYLQGLRYNETLAQRRAQAELGWRASAALTAEPAGAAVLVQLRDAGGRPLEGLSLTGALRRPVDARLDRELSFESLGQGRYRAALGELPPGAWELRAEAASGGEQRFTLARRMTWRPPA